MCVVITNHAKARIKERTSMPKKMVEKNVELAKANGVRREETSGSLRRYIDSIYYKKKAANNIRIYCGFVYVFAGDVLITAFELPPKYRSIELAIRSKRKDI